MKDAKKRFSDRVDDYKKYRPSYPSDALLYVKNICNVQKEWRIADIGSGTGISTNALLDSFQCNVYAVEPNENMRSEAEASLSDNSLFHSVNGSSEQTTLGNQSINLVAAFQAFHWFDKQKSKEEFRRILTASGWLLLVWNDRITEGSSFVEGYERIVQGLPEYSKVNHKNTGRNGIEEFIGSSDVIYREFPNSQYFDFEGLKGRFFSSSYTPPAGSLEYQEQIKKLKNLFDATNVNGQIEFIYRTQIYLGKLV
jgi:ubiquinone/menaquinone biosynthesis C-methylase UbiE